MNLATLTHLYFNVCIRNSPQHLPERELIQIEFSLRQIRYMRTKQTIPFRSIESIKRGFQNSITIQMSSGRWIPMHFGSEREAVVAEIIFGAISKEKADFELPERSVDLPVLCADII